MMLFISLFIILGLSWQVKSEIISATFQSENLTFVWTKNITPSINHVEITRDGMSSNWTRLNINVTQYTVTKVKLTESIEITVNTGSYSKRIIKCKDQCVSISTKCYSGSVIFEWTKPLNKTNYQIMIIRDRKYDNWNPVTVNQYTVKDALLFESISIIVKVSGSKVNNTLSCKVLKEKVRKGESANLSWVVPYFPRGGYHIYHTVKNSTKILTVNHNGARESDIKYKYLTRPYNSTNVMFEIKDVTLDDDGYYNGGETLDKARSCGGVVLIVNDKPTKPEIRGDLSILINTSSELTCSSNSTSAPDYYFKIVTLSYTWFVNATRMNRETNQTLRLKVIRGHKYNNYSCTATEDGLESDRSDIVHIEPLYGPDKITITPQPNTHMQDNGMVTVREGETFGPYQCLVDCHPPCNVTWTYMNSTGHLDVISTNGNLSLPQINKDIKLFQCVATWGTETKKEKNITLNVQFEDITTVSHLETNRVESLYVIIGASVAVLGLIVILVVALVISFRRRKNKEKDEGGNNTKSGGEMYATVDKSSQKPKADVVKDDVTKKQNDTTSGGEMYATVDKSRQKPKADVVKDDVTKKQNEEECIEPGTEMYAVVDKNLKRNKRGDVGEMSNKAGKSKLMTKETAGEKSKHRNNAANQSIEEGNLSTEDAARACKTNNEGLVYIEVDFTNQSKRSRTNQAPVIHGEDNRTEYTFVDFSKKAPPITDTDDKEEDQKES